MDSNNEVGSGKGQNPTVSAVNYPLRDHAGVQNATYLFALSRNHAACRDNLMFIAFNGVERTNDGPYYAPKSQNSKIFSNRQKFILTDAR